MQQMNYLNGAANLPKIKGKCRRSFDSFTQAISLLADSCEFNELLKFVVYFTVILVIGIQLMKI